MKVTIYLAPALEEWVKQEAALKHITISEQVSRLLAQQRDLRQQLSALTQSDDNASPVFQVLLERHGEKVAKTVDAAMKRIGSVGASLDLLKTMVVFGARMMLDPKQFSQWEKDVQATLAGKKS